MNVFIGAPGTTYTRLAGNDFISAQAGEHFNGLRDDWVSSVDAFLADPLTRPEALAAIQAAAARLQHYGIPAAVGDMRFGTTHRNTIPADLETVYPGGATGLEADKRLLNILRWNAAMTVAGANHRNHGIGGHLGTFASNAEIMTTLFLHFFRGQNHPENRDMLWVQGHDSPGLYAIGHALGLISEGELLRFRREVGEIQADGSIVIDFGQRKGLPSYPHGDGRPDLFDTHSVVMGWGGIASIYQGKFHQWLQGTGLKKTAGDSRCWAILGDSSMREPEHQADLEEAVKDRSKIKHLINCNRQGLDGVADGDGNGNNLEKLESKYRGAGWKVIKCIFSSEWNDLIERDTHGWISQRLSDLPDGEMHNLLSASGDYIREKFFGTQGKPHEETSHPELQALVSHLSDTQLKSLFQSLGGHDLKKVFNALKEADDTDGPALVLFSTIKGKNLGRLEAAMAVHNMKELKPEDVQKIRDQLGAPFTNQELEHFPIWAPNDGDAAIQRLREARRRLGGNVPQRIVAPTKPLKPSVEIFQSFDRGQDKALSTTQIFLAFWQKLITDTEFGALYPLIVPDELKTLGGEGMAARVAYFNARGQTWKAADEKTLTRYRESIKGLVIQTGISEVALMAMFTAMATSYATHGTPVCSAALCYSPFLFPHVGNWIYGAGDVRAKGFLVSTIEGGTTPHGEGTQHANRQGMTISDMHPRVRVYDPAHAFETGTVMRVGIETMYGDSPEDVMFSLSGYNEPLPVYARPQGVSDADIMRGLYKFSGPLSSPEGKPEAHLVASGVIFHEAKRAQGILDAYGVAAHLWSATSISTLAREAVEVERRNDLSGEQTLPLINQLLGTANNNTDPSQVFGRGPRARRLMRERGYDSDNQMPTGPVVIATDFHTSYGKLISPYLGDRARVLGTDGYGRSDLRPVLRRFYGVDAESQALAVLNQLVRMRQIDPSVAERARREMKIQTNAPSPMLVR